MECIPLGISAGTTSLPLCAGAEDAGGWEGGSQKHQERPAQGQGKFKDVENPSESWPPPGCEPTGHVPDRRQAARRWGSQGLVEAEAPKCGLGDPLPNPQFLDHFLSPSLLLRAGGFLHPIPASWVWVLGISTASKNTSNSNLCSEPELGGRRHDASYRHHVTLQGFCGLPKGPVGRCLPAKEQAGSGEFWASDRPEKKVLRAASFIGT